MIHACLGGFRPRWFTIAFARSLIGFALAGIVIQLFGAGHDLQEALFPLLFAVGVLSAWIAGPPLGWAVSAVYMFISGLGGLLLFDFQIYHGQDLFLWSLGQQETIALTVLFSVYLLLAGLAGWLSGALASWLIGRIAVRCRT
jgi:hypothetical protein